MRPRRRWTASSCAAIIDKFDGGPVGVDNLAAAIGEERDTIEDVLEPYLIQQGFLQRTPRGRVATVAAYRHFGLAQPKTAGTPELWGDAGWLDCIAGEVRTRTRSGDLGSATRTLSLARARLLRRHRRGRRRLLRELSQFMERARSEWLRAEGFEQTELANAHRVAFVVRSAAIDYLEPARFNDSLQVSVELIKVGAGHIDLIQRVTRNDELLASAVIKVACVGLRR